jgi:hypothetical protein
MKFKFGKTTFEGFSFETEGGDSSKGLILAMCISFVIAVTIGICVVVRVNFDYEYTNKPQIERKAPVSDK